MHHGGFPMLYLMSFILSLSFAVSATLGIQQEWGGISSPLIMGKNFETRFTILPMQAQVNQPKKYWSGDYWPLNKGLINHRWNSSTLKSIPAPDKEQVKSWTHEELKQLSPAEKFDLLNGRYWYPLRDEVEGYANYHAKKWEGICHGWAPASMNHNEPVSKVLKNPDGILVPFGSSDIKAILSYFYAYPYQVPNTHQMGRRCEGGMINTSEDCRQDLNAGAFHIVMANRIGLENIGFIADMDRYKEIWNHPILGYESRIIKDRGAVYHSANGAVRTVRLKTKVSYIYESKNTWEPIMGSKTQVIKTQEYKYDLDIDINGQIIGGYWKSLERPDFLWIKEKPQRYTGNYLRLPELLNDSI